MSGPKVGALFAGYGGIERALHEVLGAEPAWFSEFEKAPSTVLAHRYPGVPNHGDVTKIRWQDVEPVDIITGGSPCQDLSHAGKRAGMKAGTRSGLWASMCDAIDIIRPSLVIWENVRGAYSASAAPGPLESCDLCVGSIGDTPLRALGRVVGDLSELGYQSAWVGLRAADVGAPHGRFRVFVLAWPAADTNRADLRDAARQRPDQGNGLQPGGDGCEGDALPAWGSREWRDLTLLRTPTAQLAINGGSQHPDKRKAGGHGPTLADEIEHLLLPTPRATDGTKGGPNQRGSSGDLMLPSAVQLLPTPSAMNASNDPGSVNSWVARRDRQLARGINGNGIGTPLGIAIQLDFGQYAPAIARWEALTRTAPPPTEPTGKGGAHRLSARFVEWLMGLPDGWVTDVPISRNDQLKALGNGVCPQQCAAAVRHLLTVRATAWAVAS